MRYFLNCKLQLKFHEFFKGYNGIYFSSFQNGTPTHTAPSTPKHGVLRNEMCIVLFRKECISIYNSVVETLLSYFTEIKIASAPYYVIENISDISKIPHVKLFILVCDSTIYYGSGSKDIRIATLKVLKTWGGEPSY